MVSSTSLSLPKDSGGLNRGSSVGPVVPSGVCVLPGPSRVSSEEYDARMKSFREREEVIADARGSRESAVDISFSPIDSEFERWRISNPFLAGTLFSLGFNHLILSPL